MMPTVDQICSLVDQHRLRACTCTYCGRYTERPSHGLFCGRRIAPETRWDCSSCGGENQQIPWPQEIQAALAWKNSDGRWLYTSRREPTWSDPRPSNLPPTWIVWILFSLWIYWVLPNLAVL